MYGLSCYTKEFIDKSDKLSLSFFDDSWRKMLNYMGTVSGRDEDKIAASGLHVEMVNSAPVFKESRDGSYLPEAL